jgi:hypothetical protein
MVEFSNACEKKKMTASGWPIIMIGLVMAFNIVTHFQV